MYCTELLEVQFTQIGESFFLVRKGTYLECAINNPLENTSIARNNSFCLVICAKQNISRSQNKSLYEISDPITFYYCAEY